MKRALLTSGLIVVGGAVFGALCALCLYVSPLFLLLPPALVLVVVVWSIAGGILESR